MNHKAFQDFAWKSQKREPHIPIFYIPSPQKLYKCFHDQDSASFQEVILCEIHLLILYISST